MKQYRALQIYGLNSKCDSLYKPMFKVYVFKCLTNILKAVRKEASLIKYNRNIPYNLIHESR